MTKVNNSAVSSTTTTNNSNTKTIHIQSPANVQTIANAQVCLDPLQLTEMDVTNT